MSEPDFAPPLESKRIAILGIGLIGGSLAYALDGKCARLLGVDTDPAVVAAAGRLGIFDVVASDPAVILPQADLVIMAAPVAQILQMVRDLPLHHPGGAVVLDTGSTKSEVVSSMRELPGRFLPVGGHPMAGKEVGGLDHAEPGLFQGAAFALVRVREAAPDPAPLVESLVAAVGAHPVWLEPETHDRLAASVSHLPYLAASALVQAAPPEGYALAGPGFRSSTRLAGTPPAMMLDIIRSNRPWILAALSDFRRELANLEGLLLDGEYAALLERLEAARAMRAGFVKPAQRE